MTMLEHFEKFKIENPQMILGGGSSKGAHCDAYG